MRARNIFTATSRYAYRQGENFLTEGLAFVLETLRDSETEALEQFLENITHLAVPLDPDNLIITTQESSELGRPDLVISQKMDFVLMFELKNYSGLGQQQLERYYEELGKRDEAVRKLYLLTRSRLAARHTGLGRENYIHILWHEITSELGKLPLKGEVSKYIVKSYIGFLEDSQMSLVQINNYEAGVKNMHRMVELMTIALQETLPGEHFSPTNPWQKWVGYFWQEDKHWFGFYFENPTVVWIEKGGQEKPRPKLSLDLEEKGFFDLKSGDQLDTLIEFIEKSVTQLNIPRSVANS